MGFEDNDEITSTWYKCPECHVLLDSSVRFLSHLGNHPILPGSGGSYSLFHLADGNVVHLADTQQAHSKLFIPRIQLSPVEQMCNTFAVSVSATFCIPIAPLSSQDIAQHKAQLTSQHATTMKPKSASEESEPLSLKLKPFQCKLCHVRFSGKEYLIRHFTKHRRDNPFRCTICGLSTSTKYHMRRHMKLHYGEIFTCEICGAQLARKDTLTHHMKTVHSDSDSSDNTRPKRKPKTPVVRRLPKGTVNPFLNKTTKIVVVPKNRLLVDDNGKIKQEVDEYETGLYNCVVQSNGSGTSILPPTMSDASSRPETVKQLKEIDAEFEGSFKYSNRGVPGSFVCSICSCTFSRSFSLQQHLKTFHAEQFLKQKEIKSETFEHICAHCGHLSESASDLSAHINSNHPNVLQPWIKCPHTLCRSRCKTQAGLDLHLHTFHSTDSNATKPESQCYLCSKKFAKIESLRKHVKLGRCNTRDVAVTAEITKKEQCRYCKKYFSRVGHLRRHIRETGCSTKVQPVSGPYLCKHCGKLIKTVTSLRRHVRLHAPDRVLSICKLCNETCSNASSLRRHIHLIHGNGKYRRNKVKVEVKAEMVGGKIKNEAGEIKVKTENTTLP